MKILNRNILNHRFLKPSIFKLILKDFLNLKNPIHPNRFHIKKAINWLIFAQEKTKDGGVSLGFSLETGWNFSYP